jgi:hypothetical protein
MIQSIEQLKDPVAGIVPWNKLEKTYKLQKLYDFADLCADEHCLDTATRASLKTMLKERLNRKQLQKSKDVGYDKDRAVITEMTSLVLKDGSFSFKSSENASPLLSLAPKNKTIKQPPSGA